MAVAPLAWAALASFCWALNSFQLGVIASEVTNAGDANLSAGFIIWACCGGCGLVLLLYQASTIGVLQGVKGRQNIARSYGAGLCSSAGMLVLPLALASDPESAGFIASVMPLSGLFVSVIAWVLLGETLTVRQMLGVAIAVSGPIVMALADKSVASLTGIAGGAMAALLLGTSNFLRRSAMMHGCKDPVDVQMLVWLAFATAAVASFIVVFTSGRGLRGLDSTRHLLLAVGAGLAQAFGSWSFQLALKGQVGPATAIGNTMGVGVLILQIFFMHPQLPAFKIVGMCLCIVGASILALSPKQPLPQCEPEPAANLIAQRA